MSRAEDEGVQAPAGLAPGALVLVLGPSGVGKDALIGGAREALYADARYVFPDRIVTRPPHATESHGSMSVDAFRRAAHEGRFALAWEAHGLCYGVPASVDHALREGRVVIVNGSRTIVGAARRRYARVALVVVDCPVEIRAARIAARGRETESEIAARLNRDVATFDPAEADVRIDNSGPLEDGVRALVEALQKLSHFRNPANSP